MSCLHRNHHIFGLVQCEGLVRLEWCAECGSIRTWHRPAAGTGPRPVPNEWLEPIGARHDTQPCLDNPKTDPPPAMGPDQEQQ
jgi:hypothetical protein